MARIPNNMTEVLFISGDGNEYIETGIHLDSECIVRSRWSFNGTNACIYGCFSSSADTDNFCLYGGSHSADSYIRFNGQLVRQFRPVSGTVYTLEHSSEGFFANGTKITGFEPATFTCSAPLRIFGLPNSRYSPINGRCYGFQILKRSEFDTASTETLYDFVPVKNEDTGEVGFFETVEGNFYGNSGSGSFSPSSTIVSRPIAGSISWFRRRLMMSTQGEPEPIFYDWIAGYGGAWIDTGYKIPNNGVIWISSIWGRSGSNIGIVGVSDGTYQTYIRQSSASESEKIAVKYAGGNEGQKNFGQYCNPSTEFNIWLTPTRFGQGNKSLGTFSKGTNYPDSTLCIMNVPNIGNSLWTNRIGTVYVYGAEASGITGTSQLQSFTPVATFIPCKFGNKKGMWHVEENVFCGNASSSGNFTLTNRT